MLNGIERVPWITSDEPDALAHKHALSEARRMLEAQTSPDAAAAAVVATTCNRHAHSYAACAETIAPHLPCHDWRRRSNGMNNVACLAGLHTGDHYACSCALIAMSGNALARRRRRHPHRQHHHNISIHKQWYVASRKGNQPDTNIFMHRADPTQFSWKFQVLANNRRHLSTRSCEYLL